jgi:glycosyltransferase involved in cell wall biosynthesis
MPRISIVTSTYNRSNVLRYAVESVRRQSETDWELLIVGDHCTDDTAAVVASYADPRVTFTNLPRNHGEQSAPNNAGVALARGELVAFLNHDDLWFSDHLATLIAAIEQERADLVYSMSARIDEGGRVHLWGGSPDDEYGFWIPVPASIWLMRRDLVAKVGEWRSAAALHDAPSQDWLRRAAAAGATIRPVRRLTAVQITSGGRRNSYRDRHQHEHQEAFDALTRDEPAYRERLLTSIALASSKMATYLRPWTLARATVEAALARLCTWAGTPPVVFFNALRYRRRGGFVRHLRHTRGLAPGLEDTR